MTSSCVVEAPIRRIRLLEDRAFITRVFEGVVEQGVTSIRVPEITPVLSDNSLLARCRDDGVSVLECRVVRRTKTESEKRLGQTRELTLRLRELDQDLEKVRAALRSDERSAESYRLLMQQWLSQTAEDVAWGQANSGKWSEQFTRLREKHFESMSSHARLQQDFETQSALRDSVALQRDELLSPSDEVEATLEFTIETHQSSSVVIEIDYCVPGACWRPYHRAEWLAENLHFLCQACVWQNTGEDWEDVELTFSTQRATLGTSPPELSRDVLRVKKKQKQVVVESREESVSVSHETVDKVPGIDDGGEVLTLKAPGRTSIPSNGRPHRVELFRFQSPLAQKQIVLAELSPAVYLNTQQENVSSRPILPGPVDLVKACGLVGRSSVKHAAPGQRFDLSWGPRPEIRVHREHHKSKEDGSIVSSWKAVTHRVEIHISHLGSEPLDLVVRERIPVSEIKHVKIQQKTEQTSDKVAADEHGFVDWNVSLTGHERKTLHLVYETSKKKDVEGQI